MHLLLTGCAVLNKVLALCRHQFPIRLTISSPDVLSWHAPLSSLPYHLIRDEELADQPWEQSVLWTNGAFPRSLLGCSLELESHTSFSQPWGSGEGELHPHLST